MKNICFNKTKRFCKMKEIIKHGEVRPRKEKKLTHTCKKCGCVYSFVLDADANNDYGDYEDDLHYDCPECGQVWYKPTFGSYIRLFLRNLFT